VIRLALIALFCFSGQLLRAQSTNAPAKRDFDSFKIISQRNIFDPNRTGRGGRSESRDRARPAKTDAFALVGTMLYEKGKFAFFDSSNSDYRKVVGPSDKIAGYTITEIGPNLVKLETNGQVLEISVGQQMKRQDEGEWKLSSSRESLETQSNSTSSTESSGKGSSSSGSDDDIVKRLMQKREAEEKK
jgi:hypothetical protein